MSDPVHIISLGAGVQSSTMALMAAKGEITPMPTAAIFADTQAEPKNVYIWLDWLEKQLPFPVYRVSKGNLYQMALEIKKSKKGNLYTNHNVPVFIKNQIKGKRSGIQSRQCTANFKIIPIQKKLMELFGGLIKSWRKSRKLSDKPINQWIGISRDEIIRMKPSRKDWINNVWPLIDKGMTRKNCLDWMLKNNFPTPPRSACIFCPFHNNQEWKSLKNNSPDEFRSASEWELKYQSTLSKIERMKGKPFLHSSCVPISEIDFNGELIENQQINFFNNECEGMCGV